MRFKTEENLGLSLNGRIDRAGKLVNFTLLVVDGVNFAGPFLLHFIDSNHRVHRDVSSFDTRELGLQPLLCGVNHDRASFSEKQALDFDKPKHRAMADATSVDLVDLALI